MSAKSDAAEIDPRIEAAAAALFYHRTAFADGRIPCDWDYDFSGPFALGAEKQSAFNDASMVIAVADSVRAEAAEPRPSPETP